MSTAPPDRNYDFVAYDYSFALSQDNNLTITETVKDPLKKPTTNETIASLSALIGNLKNKEIAEQPKKDLEVFIKKFTTKVEKSIKAKFCGRFIAWLQRAIGFGALSQLDTLKNDVTAIRNSQDATIKVVFKNASQMVVSTDPSPLKPDSQAFLPRVTVGPVLGSISLTSTPLLAPAPVMAPGSVTSSSSAAKPSTPSLSSAPVSTLVSSDPVEAVHNVLKGSLEGDIPNAMILKEKLKEKIAADSGYKWLEATLKLDLTDESARLLVSLFKEIQAPPMLKSTLERVVARFEQMTLADFEERPLTPQQILHMAFFIEVRIHSVVESTQKFFKAQGAEGLARAVQVDLATRDVYVIADPEKSKLKGGGAFKKVANAVRLPFNNFSRNPEIAAQLSTTADREALALMTPKKLGENVKKIRDTQFPALKAELSYFTKYRGPGIADFYTVTDYTETITPKSKGAKKPMKSVEVPRMSIMFKRSNGDLQKVIKDKQAVEPRAQIHMATQLSTFFERMHANGDIHGDIKGDNILLYDNNRLGVTDFGVTFDVDDESETPGREEFNGGAYGTVKNSSPELFNVNNFEGDCSKTDCWALGCVLYGVHFRESPPWENMLHAFRQVCYGNDKEFKQLLVEMESWPPEEKTKVEEVLGRYIARREKKASGLVDQKKEVPKIAEQVKTYLIAQVKEHVEGPWSELDRKKQAGTPALTADEQYKYMVYGALRLDPEQRLSMTQVREAAAAIR